jgi:aerobic carbon-monoxide dehydrogenase large subunit
LHPAHAREGKASKSAGMGEGGAVAPPAAIANAVRDALISTGAEVNETPITPRRVMAAIRTAREVAPRP